MSVEYASKGVAGTGLGLGIAGTALGVLASNNNGNGLLGGLLGGGCSNQISALQTENALLKAENYSDKNAKEVYSQSLNDDRALRSEMYAFIKPLADESANNRVELAKLQAEVKCNAEKAELREQIVIGKINEVALSANGRFAALDQTINCISNTVNSVTKVVVPNSSVCPGWGPTCTHAIPCPTTAAPAAPAA